MRALILGAGALALSGCAQLTDAGVTPAVQNCASYAALDLVQRADSYGLGLLIKIGQAGVGCYLTPPAAGEAATQVVAIPAGAPVPRAAETIVTPAEAAAVVPDGF